MAELPSGTVTFLFTDLEGSTRLWEEFPDAMRPALACHDAILRDAVAEHDGHMVSDQGFAAALWVPELLAVHEAALVESLGRERVASLKARGAALEITDAVAHLRAEADEALWS